MIPSDHFVRFYNEVFKFLDARNGLQQYYAEISHHQEFHCLENFQKNGIQGIYDYYLKIRKEENCEMEIKLINHGIILRMTKCPSLSKAINNDAGVCPKYCMHCLGWTAPLYQKANLYQIYDLMGMDDPRCCEYIFDDQKIASDYYRNLMQENPKANIRINFELV